MKPGQIVHALDRETDELQPIEVVRVGTKYFWLRDYPVRFSKESLEPEDYGRLGKVYLDSTEYDNIVLANRLIREILVKMYRVYSLDLREIQKIADILGIK